MTQAINARALAKLRSFDRHWPNALPIFLVALTVVIANILMLTRVVDENPINWLSGLAVVSHPGIIPGQNTIDPSVGWITQGLGHYAALSLLHGHIPWWNPYEGLGMPLAGEMGSAALFPATLLQILPNGHLYFIIFLELVAGLSTYFLARRFTISRWSAVAAAMAFSVNGTFAWLSHAPVNAVAFLPMILLGIEMAADAARRRERYGWTFIAVGIALSIYGGFPEEVFWFIPFGVAWAVFRLVPLVRTGAARRFAGKLALGGVGGVLLAAPLLVAFYTFFLHAIGPPHQPSNYFSTPPHAVLATQILPYLYGPIGAFSSFDPTNTVAGVWNSGGFLNSSLLVLAFIGATGRTHRPLRLFLAISVLVAFARMMGFWPITHLIALLPGSWIDYERYAAPTWEIAMALLAAFGVDDAINRVISLRRLFFSLAFGLGVIGICYLTARGVLAGVAKAPDASLWIGLSIIWALALVVTVVIAVRFGGRLRPTWLLLLVALDATALYVVPQLSSQRNVTNDYAAVHYLQAHLGLARFATLGPIAPDYGSYFQIAAINIEDIPIPTAYSSLVLTQLDPGIGQAFNFTGINYWQAPGQPSVATEFFTHLQNYERVGTKYLVTPAGLSLTPSQVSKLRLRQVFSDPLARIYALPAPAPFYATMGDSPCKITDASIAGATISCEAPTILVRRELYLPGWATTVNGEQKPMYSQNGLFQAVRIPSGRARVTFSFAPPHIELGWLAFVAGIVLLAASGVERLRRRSSSSRIARSTISQHTVSLTKADAPLGPTMIEKTHEDQ